MIDIIIKRDNHKRNTECPRCGSELAYAEEDTTFVCDRWEDYGYDVIKCPIAVKL